MKTTAILDMLLEKVYDIFWFLFKHDMRAANVMGGGGGGQRIQTESPESSLLAYTDLGSG